MNENSEILTRLGLLQRAVEHLTAILEAGKGKATLGDWISEAEAIGLTGLSRGTLLKLRNEGTISCSTLSGKSNFYRIGDFKKLLEKNEKER